MAETNWYRDKAAYIVKENSKICRLYLCYWSTLQTYANTRKRTSFLLQSDLLVILRENTWVRLEACHSAFYVITGVIQHTCVFSVDTDDVRHDVTVTLGYLVNTLSTMRFLMKPIDLTGSVPPMGNVISSLYFF